MTQFKSKPFAVHLTELTGCKSNKFFDLGFLYRMLTISFLNQRNEFIKYNKNLFYGTKVIYSILRSLSFIQNKT